MPAIRPSRDYGWLATLIAIVLVVAILSLARVVLIPLALAILLTFMLAPLCDRLERWRLGRIWSVAIVTALSFFVLGAIGWIGAGQVIDLAEQLPKYQDNIRAKIQTIQISGGGPITRATNSIKQLTEEILGPPLTAPESPDQSAVPQAAVPVQIVDGTFQPLQRFIDALQPIWDPLISAGIVIVFVIFMLLQRDELRDRVIRLIGEGRLPVATQALDDAARRVSRFILMLFIINGTYGIALGAGLMIIGVPNAVLWGVCAALFRFVPYVGPWLGALLPIGMALAAFETWMPVLLTVVLFVVIELISNNVMEPWLYGSRTGVSSVAVVASAVFWAWLWGPVGLVLATPLTVCLVVMGRYIPRLEFLSVLLSDEPGLTPAARLYQRLLAMDQDDVLELAETHLTEKSLGELYDEVLLPALALAERDRHRGRIEPEREQVVYQMFRDLVDELGERASAKPPEGPAGASGRFSPVLAVAVNDAADEIAAAMLGQLLQSEGVEVRLISAAALTTELLAEIEKNAPALVCLSAVPPQALTRTRLLCKRLAAKFPEQRVVVGYWHAADLESSRLRLKACGPDRVVGTLSDALILVRG